MKFANKVFLFSFLMAAALSLGVTWVSRTYMKQNAKATYVSKYSLLSETVAHTLNQLELNAEAFMYSAGKVVATEDDRFGLLSPERLKQLRDELRITHIFVIDPKGDFIRSTNEDPSLIPNLNSFCAEYGGLFIGKGQSMVTPIIPPRPEPKPFKFLTLPNLSRTRLIHVGLRVDFIAGTLSKALQADPTVSSINLYAPEGTSLGKFSRTEFDVARTKENLPEQVPSLVETGSEYRFFTKVQSTQRRCCQCDVAGITKNGEYYYVLESRISKAELNAALASIEKFFLFVTASSLLLSLMAARIISRTLVQRLERVTYGIRAAKDSKSLGAQLQVTGRDEIALLAVEFNGLLRSLSDAQTEIVNSKRQAAIIELAKQVAHDIRSPLAALDVTVSSIEADIPEDSRRMLRSAAGRIRDIANDLINENRRSAQGGVLVKREHEAPTVYLLSSLVEQVVSEKRIQLSSKMNIELDALLGRETYGLFVEAQGVELKRVLSNLIDNAVEALPGAGKVTLRLSMESGQTVLHLSDNGKGIPEEILGRLGEQGFTHGKVGGSGLGLHHARSAVQRWGGRLDIRSTLGAGTTVEIRFPQASPPAWFIEKVELHPDKPVLILDDNKEIHAIWDQLLASYTAAGLRVLHFTEARLLSTWIAEHRGSQFLALVDYELLRQELTGLDVIEREGIAGLSILVTSRYAEPSVLQRAAKLGLKIIPKELVGLVPIAFALPVKKVEAPVPPSPGGTRVLVIDDDEMIAWAWRKQQKRLGVAELRTFSSMEACEAAGVDYAAFDLAFVDLKIPQTSWQLDATIRRLKERGVHRVFVATGDPDMATNKLCREADGVAEEKVPQDLTAYITGNLRRPGPAA